MKAEGIVRKFGAVLRHQRAGYTRNSMVAWEVPEARCDEAGRIFASRREVTHCYRREPMFLGRYSVFTMVHFREGEGAGFLEELAARAGAASSWFSQAWRTEKTSRSISDMRGNRKDGSTWPAR